MSIINISITESEAQIVSGIPKTVILQSSVPCSIFYSLDGSDPDINSLIYVSPIYLPYDKGSVILKIFATNGVDSSPIITETYSVKILDNTRLPRSATTASPGAHLNNLYPFGTNPIEPVVNYLNPAEATHTVNDPSLPQIPNGYDADGYPAVFSNEEYSSLNYQILYSTTNSIGETGPGIGTLPASVTIQPPVPPPNESEQFTKLFDPRAFVIYQDFSKENPEDPPQINKEYFSLEDSNKVRDGNNYFNHGLDSPGPTGSFVKQCYNPRENTITYYYRDNASNRWIISKMPYKPTGTWDGNLANVKFGRTKGVGVVYRWIPFARRILF